MAYKEFVNFCSAPAYFHVISLQSSNVYRIRFFVGVCVSRVGSISSLSENIYPDILVYQRTTLQ